MGRGYGKDDLENRLEGLFSDITPPGDGAGGSRLDGFIEEVLRARELPGSPEATPDVAEPPAVPPAQPWEYGKGEQEAAATISWEVPLEKQHVATAAEDGEQGRPPRHKLDPGAWRSRLMRAVAQLRVKLTLPYVFLALVVAFVAALLVSRLVVDLLDNLFRDSLVRAAQETADTVVYVEQNQLADMRLLLYTEGLAEAVQAGDGDALSQLATPLVVNERVDCLEVLDASGRALLALHHQPEGGVTAYSADPGADYGAWESVQKVLNGEEDEAGDKHVDLVEADWGWTFYVAGPVKLGGEVVGVLMVGTYLDTLVQRLDDATLAHVSIYRDGVPIATMLDAEAPVDLTLDAGTYQSVLDGQGRSVYRRQISVGGRDYAEIFHAFEVRDGQDLGVLSVAMPLSVVTDANSLTRSRLVTLFSVVIAATLAIGAWLASTVVRRVGLLASATQQVARGDLTTRVEARGYDEVASLASDFNRMVVQLREGRTYRDLLGLTASPEVAEQLRQSVEGGAMRLDAQLATASILFCDIRGFTRLAEQREPQAVIRLLNEYMQGVIEIIRNHNGVVNKFSGDATLAFFGLLPDRSPVAEGAAGAISAALAMLAYLEDLNRRRRERSEEPLRVGIGVNTGPVVAGIVGSDVRLEYTVIGDAVNVAQRLSDLNKEYPQYDLFISQGTCCGLREDMTCRPVHIGETRVKGRSAPVDVFALAKEEQPWTG